MINCSYCDAIVNRLVFCSPSHKVLYHRKKLPLGKQVGTKDTIQVEEEVGVLTKSNVPTQIQKKLDKNGFCQHFVKGTGYCRSCDG